MTPAINLLKKKKIPFTTQQYSHDPFHSSFGLEAMEKLNLPGEVIFKTLVVQTESGLFAVAVIPVQEKLSFKKMAHACSCKKVAMAKAADVERVTGYVLGGVSPLGQKKRLLTRVHSTAEEQDAIYISAGKRGLEVGLAPAELLKLTTAEYYSLTE